MSLPIFVTTISIYLNWVYFLQRKNIKIDITCNLFERGEKRRNEHKPTGSITSTFNACNLWPKPNKLMHFENTSMWVGAHWLDGVATLALAVSYRRKMFMKLTMEIINF